MKKRSLAIINLTLTFLLLAACNLPVEQVPPPSDVQTAAALTVEALLATATLPAEQPVQAEVTSTFTPAPTGTITPTFSTPMLTVLEQTNCREGPGQEYDVVFTYLPKKKLQILGRYDPNNYWLVKSEESKSGQCWLWGEYTEVTGSYWVVQSVTPPPTFTPSLPAAPALQKWDFYCNLAAGQLEASIIWSDKANGEDGYRVIRDNVVVAELPPNTSKYSEVIAISGGERVTYYIEVYNITGSVRSSPINWTC